MKIIYSCNGKVEERTSGFSLLHDALPIAKNLFDAADLVTRDLGVALVPSEFPTHEVENILIQKGPLKEVA